MPLYKVGALNRITPFTERFTGQEKHLPVGNIPIPTTRLSPNASNAKRQIRPRRRQTHPIRLFHSLHQRPHRLAHLPIIQSANLEKKVLKTPPCSSPPLAPYSASANARRTSESCSPDNFAPAEESANTPPNARLARPRSHSHSTSRAPQYTPEPFSNDAAQYPGEPSPPPPSSTANTPPNARIASFHHRNCPSLRAARIKAIVKSLRRVTSVNQNKITLLQSNRITDQQIGQPSIENPSSLPFLPAQSCADKSFQTYRSPKPKQKTPAPQSKKHTIPSQPTANLPPPITPGNPQNPRWQSPEQPPKS